MTDAGLRPQRHREYSRPEHVICNRPRRKRPLLVFDPSIQSNIHDAGMKAMTFPRQYDPKRVERKWQDKWRHEAAFAPSDSASSRFIYACTPFTTGKAHMGHVRSYTIADALARRDRSEGHSVLWAMGFDAFGLPNEIAAIEHAVSPRDWVAACCRQMTAQFERLGLSVDPTRRFVTSDPEYYGWTQWVFLRFLERGLVYRAVGVENWCDRCKCVLAALQVTDEHSCWRCGHPVRLTCVPQWYMRLLPYAKELERNLADLSGWDETVLASQKAQLGRTDGEELDVALPSGDIIPVFNAFPDARASATFIALSPNHPLLETIIPRGKLDFEVQRRRTLTRDERSASRIDVMLLDLVLFVAELGRALPLVVTPAVDMRFGSGASLGIPARDPIDAALATQAGLDLEPRRHSVAAGHARPAMRYRLRDNSISRQRSWGAPIPVIHCTTCGLVPVPDRDLPVRLPDDLMPTGEASPLVAHREFATCKCPQCGRAARRDTDTLDVHIDSIWMLVPFCVPPEARAAEMFTHPDLKRWLPVSQVVCGADQAGWWINDRVFFKVMRDCGYLDHIPDSEPVTNLLMHEMVLANGRKMSKSLGNAVDPDAVIEQWGADAVRLSVLKVNPRKAFNWTEETLRENHEFLTALWTFAAALGPKQQAGALWSDPRLRRLARWRDAAARKIATAYRTQSLHLVQKELKALFARLQDFRQARPDRGPERDKDRAATLELLRFILGELEPLAPHIAAELKEMLALRTHGTGPAATSSSHPMPRAAETVFATAR